MACIRNILIYGLKTYFRRFLKKTRTSCLFIGEALLSWKRKRGSFRTLSENIFPPAWVWVWRKNSRLSLFRSFWKLPWAIFWCGCVSRFCRAFCSRTAPSSSLLQANTIQLKQGKKFFFPLQTIYGNRCFSLISYTRRTFFEKIKRKFSFCPCLSFF